MPDDRVKISALDSASTMETGDLFPVTQERSGVLSTKKATMTQLASEVVNGIEYTTALNTDDKKPIGAINELLDRLIALLPVVSFTPTPLATLTDGAENVPMKSLVVDIVPKETGTGTKSPSNPYVISGTDEVVITHTGKNLLNESAIVQGAIKSNDGGIDASSTIRVTTDFIEIVGGNTYIVSIESGKKFVACHLYDKDKNSISQNLTTNPITVSQSAKYIRIMFGYDDNSTIIPNDISSAQLETGTTATAYEPYQTPTTTTIALPSTVYGGEVDVVSGQGKDTHNLIDLGTLSWSEANNSMWVAVLSGMEAVATNRVPPFICEEYNAVSWQDGTGSTAIDNCFCVLPQYNQIRVRNLACTTQAEFEEAINGVHLCYRLATPTPITTTPIQIKTQGGTESIFADCGDVSGEYRADIQKYIDGLVNNGGNRSLNSLILSKGASEEEPEKEEVKEEEPKEEEKK